MDIGVGVDLDVPSDDEDLQPTSRTATTNTKSVFQELCFVCEKDKGKYRCPKCEIVLCSLECSKSHKKERQCTGKRKRAQYVPLQIMDEHDLVNDLCLLEDAKRAKLASETAVDKQDLKNQKGISKRTRQLLQEARAFDIRITLLPSFMARHRENTTSYDFKRLMILWRVEFVFTSSKSQTLTLPKVEDVKSLSELMAELLRRASQEPTEAAGAVQNPQIARHARHKHLLTSVQNVIAANKQELSIVELTKGIYPDNTEQWCFFFKHPKCPANSPLYYRLLPTDSLRRSLEHKEVMEYPTIFVAATAEGFPLYTPEAYAAIEDTAHQESEEREAKLRQRQEEAEHLEDERFTSHLEVLKSLHHLPVLEAIEALNNEIGETLCGEPEPSVGRDSPMDTSPGPS